MRSLILLAILFDGYYGAYWAPNDGGPVAPIVENQVTKSASNGERAFIARFAPDGLRAGVYDEGATSPIAESLLAESFDNTHPPIVIWDGTRFVVFWIADGITHGAAINTSGVVTSRFEFADLTSISDAASNGSTIALIRLFETDTHSGNAEVLLLDAEFHVVKRTLAGSIARATSNGHTILSFARISAFGNGYYAAWQQERTARYLDVVGTRITADGTALDVVPSTREHNSLMGSVLSSTAPLTSPMYDLELLAHRGRMLAIMKRTWGYEVTATAIDANGAIEGPVHVGGKYNMPSNAETIVRPNGTLALSWFESDGIATIQPFKALSGAPRRRAARH